MSLLISHRGNIDGIEPLKENSPQYIEETLNKGYHVVVDTWLIGKEHLSLGSEQPTYPITLKFLKNNNIICRAKNVVTLEYLLTQQVHCFIHDRDDYVLTNGGLIWSAPGKSVMTSGIMSMPEYVIPDISSLAILPCAGICSNYIKKIKDTRDQLEQNGKDKDK